MYESELTCVSVTSRLTRNVHVGKPLLSNAFSSKPRTASRMTFELIDEMERLGTPRILVIGDLILDRYVWGDAERISQEAPVILLRADKREERLGGASSVANLLRALGAEVALTG